MGSIPVFAQHWKNSEDRKRISPTTGFELTTFGSGVLLSTYVSRCLLLILFFFTVFFFKILSETATQLPLKYGEYYCIVDLHHGCLNNDHWVKVCLPPEPVTCIYITNHGFHGKSKNLQSDFEWKLHFYTWSSCDLDLDLELLTYFLVIAALSVCI